MKDFRHSGRTAPVKTPRVCRYPECECGIQGCGLPAPKERPKTRCPKCERVSINTTCPICVVPTVPVEPEGRFDPRKLTPEPQPFAEQFMEALGEHIDARISYAETRRGPNAEYANNDDVVRSGLRLEGLLNKVRISL